MLEVLKNCVNELDQRNQWEKYLSLLDYAYSNTVHSSTKKTSFEIVEGRSKVPPLLRTHDKIFAVDEYYVHDLQSAFQKVKYDIQYSQHKHKLAADKHRRVTTFKVDDWVLLKFPKARLQHTLGKHLQGEQTGH